MPLENNKILISISSKGKSKSDGCKLTTKVKQANKAIFLLDNYDKSEKSNIAEKELIRSINETK